MQRFSKKTKQKEIFALHILVQPHNKNTYFVLAYKWKHYQFVSILFYFFGLLPPSLVCVGSCAVDSSDDRLITTAPIRFNFQWFENSRGMHSFEPHKGGINRVYTFAVAYHNSGDFT